MLNKSVVIAELNKQLQTKLTYLNTTLQQAIDSRNSDTKSSAGDKFETSREMAHIEIHKLEAEILKTQQFLYTVRKQEGRLITTDKGIFLILLPYGEIKIDNISIFCISNQAPISKLLVNTKVGNTFIFGTHSYTIS